MWICANCGNIGVATEGAWCDSCLGKSDDPNIEIFRRQVYQELNHHTPPTMPSASNPNSLAAEKIKKRLDDTNKPKDK